MPTNHTANYQLNQWVKSDQVRMEDFNADNAKIDAALKAEADARTALAAQVALRGNCKIWSTTYIGTGDYGQDHPTSLTFPGLPICAIIFGPGATFMPLVPGTDSIYFPGNYRTPVKWTGSTASWHIYTATTAGGQMNAAGAKYLVVALYQSDQG